MQRTTNQHQLRLITELSITPMLSLALVILLVFMLAGPLLQDAGGSRPASAESEAPENVARLTVDKRQSLWLDGSAIEQADLKSTLDKLARDKPGTGVLVQIDPSVPVQGLVQLMDTLRQAGIQKTAVKTLEK